MALILLSYFCSLSIPCLLEPLFPAIAPEKGMSSTLVGLLFGTTLVLNSVSASFSQPLLSKVGLKRCFVLGCFVAGSCSLLMGFLDRCPPGAPFISISFVTLCAAAIGDAGVAVTANCAPPLLYPEHVGRAVGCIVLTMTAAYAFSPAVGGALSAVGGFGAPFFAFGTALLLLAVASAAFVSIDLRTALTARQAFNSARRLLAQWPVLAAAANIFSAALPTGFLGPTLEPFLSATFRLGPAQIGLVFLLSAIGGFTTPLVGMLSDRVPVLTKVLQGPCLALTAVCVLLYHPASFLGLGAPRLWLTCTTLAATGVLLASCMTLMSSDLFAESRRAVGSKDNFVTATGLLFNLVYSVGLFVGSLFGGSALDTFGFEKATIGLSFFLLGLSCINLIYQLLRVRALPEEVEEAPATEGETEALRSNESLSGEDSEVELSSL